MRLAPAIPIIRIFSEDKAREFYFDFLGFTLQWEHRFEPGFPLYAQIRRSDLTLHLSEHHGDATPGATIFVPVEDIDALQRDLAARHYKYARPGIEELPWGRQIKLADPLATASGFANRPVVDGCAGGGLMSCPKFRQHPARPRQARLCRS